jgi:tetratricopeptide (TPR) repeat protein
MLADRLGAIDRAPDSPVWKNARRLRSAMPVEFARQEAIRFYRRSLEGAPDSPFRVQRHLGEMLVNTGSAGEARELFQAALAQRDRRCSGTGCEREEAADLRDLAEVEEGAGKASEGRKLWVEATSIVNRLYRDYPWDAAIGRFWVRHTLRWARAHNARAEARAGLEKMDQLASGEHAPIDFVDFAARTYLEVVPASLRNRAKARDYAMRAVSRSNGQVAEYLATLAAVTDDPGDVRKAAGVSWKEGEIVRPLVPAGAVAEFDRTQKLLEQMARGAQ